MKRLLVMALIVTGSCVVNLPLVVAEAPSTAIAKDAEWHPTDKTMQKIRQSCASLHAPDFGKCFVGLMPKLGATPRAVAFAKSTGNTGYLAQFSKVGPVDLAYVVYPFRANENEGWLLVNGDPPIIDVDALTNLRKGQLERDPTYVLLKKKFPNVMLFPGDRSRTLPPKAIRLPTKGQRFLVKYKLLNGCHACEPVGEAEFSFDFDPSGKFLGTQLRHVEPVTTAK
ncbi:MAG: hypothetical protein WBG50_22320 [Desulfomonilaceae bacterium]